MGTTPQSAVGKVSESAKRPQPKGGSRKGVPNRATAIVRDSIARLAEGNVERLQDWLDDIAANEKQGPAVAFKLYMDMLEYHIPKLARTEHTGENGGAVKFEVSAPWLQQQVQKRNSA